MSNKGERSARCTGEYIDTFPDQAAGEAGVAPDASFSQPFDHAASLCMTFYFVSGVGNDHTRSIYLG
jgi:hypothetical protein